MSLIRISQERRSDPVAFFREILQTYFADNGWDESLGLWRIALANGPPFPEDVSWTHEEQVAWLRERTAELRAEYEKFSRSSCARLAVGRP